MMSENKSNFSTKIVNYETKYQLTKFDSLVDCDNDSKSTGSFFIFAKKFKKV